MKKKEIKLYYILLLSDTNVGKTSLLNRYLDQKFYSNHNATIGIDCRIKLFEYDEQKIRFGIWDINGCGNSRENTQNYIRCTNAFILIYDITDRVKFEELNIS